MKILSQMYPRARKPPLNFGSHPDPASDPESPYLDGIRSRSAFAEARCKNNRGGGLRSLSALVVFVIAVTDEHC